MAKQDFAVVHDLSTLLVPGDEVQGKKNLQAYLDKVSEFIGLPAELNGLDTIWMNNENGPGRSLVVYARRGTAEILRNTLGIEVSALVNQEIRGCIVFTATGKNAKGRQEIATGSKDISKVNGKQLDDAIMTASTRALRRLTMQFTSLGILDESEVVSVVGQEVNPAGSAQLASNPTPPVFSAPTAPANNAPGKDVTAPAVPADKQFLGQQSQIDEAMGKLRAQHQNPPNEGVSLQTISAETSATNPAIKAATEAPAAPVTPAVAPVTTETEPDKQAATESAKPKRKRKPRAVALDDVEAETVSNVPKTGTSVPETGTVSPNPPVSANVETPKISEIPAPPPPVPASEPSAPPVAAVSAAGMPSEEQMADYRKKVSVVTAELKASENLGPVQKMRAFITHMSGTPPQQMTVVQWEEQIEWFAQFVGKNSLKGLVKYIDDVLGVK